MDYCLTVDVCIRKMTTFSNRTVPRAIQAMPRRPIWNRKRQTLSGRTHGPHRARISIRWITRSGIRSRRKSTKDAQKNSQKMNLRTRFVKSGRKFRSTIVGRQLDRLKRDSVPFAAKMADILNTFSSYFGECAVRYSIFQQVVSNLSPF